MKIFVKLLVLLLVLGLAAPFIMKRPDGRPWMALPDVLPDTGAASAIVSRYWSGLRDRFNTPEFSVGTDTGPTQVYKWRDSAGNWQYSDKPNPAGASETLWVDPNSNLVQATVVPEPPKKPKIADEVTAQDGKIGVPLPLTVQPGQVSTLIQDARQVQELMNGRQQTLDAYSGGSSTEQ